MNTTDTTELKEFLSYVNALVLQRRISSFRAMNFRNLSSVEITKAIFDVILFTTPSAEYSVLPKSGFDYKRGSKLFRVRKLKPDDHTPPLKEMSRESDVWEPPVNIAKVGRLNNEGESLLYLSDNPYIAIEEMKIQAGELFSLIVYELNEDIKTTAIGCPVEHEDFTEDELLKIGMLQDFLKHEFCRDVGAGTEFLYKISSTITKDHFDLPWSDGWTYPSIAKKDGFNICFRPDVAHQKLKFIGVMFASLGSERSHPFKVKGIAHGYNADGIFLYHPIGSIVQKNVFPEIR